MTQQTFGETLFKGIPGSGGVAADDWIYTPWMTTGGDRATLGVEVLVISGVTLTWNVETKKAEDSDADGIVMGGSHFSTSTTGVSYSTVPLVGFKELYRFKFATGSGAATTDFVNFRTLPPAWQLDGRP